MTETTLQRHMREVHGRGDCTGMADEDLAYFHRGDHEHGGPEGFTRAAAAMPDHHIVTYEHHSH